MSQNNNFIKGALIGGLFGGVAGLLMAPKSGKDLYQDLVNGCNSLNAKGCELSQNIKDKGRTILDALEESEDSSDSSNRAFLIGSALGTVIAAIAALLLAPQSGEKLRHSLGDTYHNIYKKAEKFAANINSTGHHVAEEITDWKDSLIDIVDKLSHSKSKQTNSHLNDILDYAALGIQLFQQLKKGR